MEQLYEDLRGIQKDRENAKLQNEKMLSLIEKIRRKMRYLENTNTKLRQENKKVKNESHEKDIKLNILTAKLRNADVYTTVLEEENRELTKNTQEQLRDILELENELEFYSTLHSNRKHRMFIPCEFDICEKEYVIYGGKWCKEHNERTKAWAVMSATHLDSMLTKSQILETKDKKASVREDTLRNLNNKLLRERKEGKSHHKKQINKLQQQVTHLKHQLKETKYQYDQFKQRYISRIKDQMDDQTQKLLDAETLIETYTTHKDNIQLLKDYETFDRFIQNTCYERTGQERDYYATPPIYNNIYTLTQLKNIDDFVKTAFNMSTREFKAVFLNLKRQRVSIAHPPVKSDIDIDSIRRLVQKYHHCPAPAGRVSTYSA